MNCIYLLIIDTNILPCYIWKVLRSAIIWSGCLWYVLKREQLKVVDRKTNQIAPNCLKIFAYCLKQYNYDLNFFFTLLLMDIWYKYELSEFIFFCCQIFILMGTIYYYPMCFSFVLLSFIWTIFLYKFEM